MEPIYVEVDKIQEVEQTAMKVFFPDETGFRLLMVTDETTTEQVVAKLGEVLRLNHPTSFALYEMETVKRGWEEERYKIRENMDRQALIDDIPNFPLHRCAIFAYYH